MNFRRVYRFISFESRLRGEGDSGEPYNPAEGKSVGWAWVHGANASEQTNDGSLHEPERRTPVRREQTLSSNDRAGPEAGAPIPLFMVPMHGIKAERAFDEPAESSNRGLAWESGAEDARTPNADAWSIGAAAREAFWSASDLSALSLWRATIRWFMVPMHGRNGEGAFHEPWMCRADIPVCRFGRLSSHPKQK